MSFPQLCAKVTIAFKSRKKIETPKLNRKRKYYEAENSLKNRTGNVTRSVFSLAKKVKPTQMRSQTKLTVERKKEIIE